MRFFFIKFTSLSLKQNITEPIITCKRDEGLIRRERGYITKIVKGHCFYHLISIYSYVKMPKLIHEFYRVNVNL